jgi:hypothetical protein
MKQSDMYYWSYLAQFFLELTTFQTNVLQKIKALPSCSILSPENLAAYEIMWKNVVESDATDEIWRKRNACWVPKGTKTHSQNVTRIAHSTTTIVARTRLNVTLFGKKIFCTYSSVLIVSTYLCETFVILRNTERDVIKHVTWSSSFYCSNWCTQL